MNKKNTAAMEKSSNKYTSKTLKAFFFSGTSFIVLFPMLALFLDAAYSYVTEGVVEHLFQGMTKIAVIQTAVLGSTAIILRRGRTWRPMFSIFSIIVFFIALTAYAGIQYRKTKMTSQHVRKVVSAKKIRTETIPNYMLSELSELIIDEDFIPNSWSNKISGYYRKERRQLICDVINSLLVEGEKKLEQDDFLLPKDDVEFLNKVYVWFCVSVSVFFFFYLVVYFSYLYSVVRDVSQSEDLDQNTLIQR